MMYCRTNESRCRLSPTIGAILLGILLCVSPLAHAAPITRPIAKPGDDRPFLLRFRTAGLAGRDRACIRVLDGDRVAAYRVVAHDPAGETWLVVDPQRTGDLSLQYDAQPFSNAQELDSLNPSLIVQTFALPTQKTGNGDDLLGALLKSTPQGTMQLGAVSIAYNPFGENQNFATLVQGTIELSNPREFRLFSVHDDAAYAQIDGKWIAGSAEAYVESDSEILESKAKPVNLSAGKHTLRYVHMQRSGRSLAILGRMDGERAVPLRGSFFEQQSFGTLGPATSEPGKPAVGLDMQILDGFTSDGTLFVRVRLQPIAPAPQGMRYALQFGDGTTMEQSPAAAREADKEPTPAELLRRAWRGGAIDHVFVTRADTWPNWRIQLTLLDAAGETKGTATTMLTQTPVSGGSLDEDALMAAYASAAAHARYDRATEATMAPLISLLVPTGRAELIAPIADAYFARFGKRGDESVQEALVALASFLRQSDPVRAEQLFGEVATSNADSWTSAKALAEQIDLQIWILGRTEGVRNRMVSNMRGRNNQERALLMTKLADEYRAAGRNDLAEQAIREEHERVTRGMDARQVDVLQRAHRETALSYLQQDEFALMRDELYRWEAAYPGAKLGRELPLLTGRYYQAVGDDKRALIEFEQILKLNPLHPSKPEILFRIGELKFTTGDRDGAKAAFEEMVKEYPRSPFAERAKLYVEGRAEPGDDRRVSTAGEPQDINNWMEGGSKATPKPAPADETPRGDVVLPEFTDSDMEGY